MTRRTAIILVAALAALLYLCILAVAIFIMSGRAIMPPSQFERARAAPPLTS
jgi:hypothetical protein